MKIAGYCFIHTHTACSFFSVFHLFMYNLLSFACLFVFILSACFYFILLYCLLCICRLLFQVLDEIKFKIYTRRYKRAHREKNAARMSEANKYKRKRTNGRTNNKYIENGNLTRSILHPTDDGERDRAKWDVYRCVFIRNFCNHCALFCTVHTHNVMCRHHFSLSLPLSYSVCYTVYLALFF